MELLRPLAHLLKFNWQMEDLTGSLGFSLERKYTTDKETMELMPKNKLTQT